MSKLESTMPQFDLIHGRDLLRETGMFANPPIAVVTMADLWPGLRRHFPGDVRVHLVESMERSALERDLANFKDVSTVVGLGGGQAIDAAKYFAWRLNIPLFQYPTSLSVDAVFGHRAGVRESGIVRYVGFKRPEAIYIDMDVIESAPIHINRAGIGDVFCFFTGVWDWQHSRDRGQCEPRWPYREDLCCISLAKAESALAMADEIRDMTPAGIQVMVDALRWGGASFHGAGWCPRHIEGVEHYFFYALEAMTKKKFLHGQAVCLGILAGALMHGKRAEELASAIHRIGVDVRPDSMGISWQDVETALRGLKGFVMRENLAHGIAHDFEVTDSFVSRLRELVNGP